MKFSEIKYERVDMEALENEVMKKIEAFNAATTAIEQIELVKEINKMVEHGVTMLDVCYIRFTLNTKDEFYSKEMDYADETIPKVQGLLSKVDGAVVKTKFRAELEAEFGEVLFMKAENALKSYSDEIKEDLVVENKLVASYVKLTSSANIEYKGEKYNLSQLRPFMVDKDRSVRKEVNELFYGFYNENLEELDRIYDELVKIRHKIAKKLGFENFIELGYYRMDRMDYNKDMVAEYRQQVLDYLVPVTKKLRDRQQKRLGYDRLEYYDLDLMFTSGNPKPQGDPNWIVDKGVKMYDELSPETGAFFRQMKETEYIDLVAKKGKSGGGYCAFLNEFQTPFVFSNFNGTYGDITVLTHEMGHAFQGHMSRDIVPMSIMNPTSESAEIHSMSMEFLTYPWMKEFFGPDTDKFKFMHLSEGLLFIPYGVCVDEFQHVVYENPEMTPAQRRAKWRELELKYLPVKEGIDNEFLANGGFFMRQSHIYEVPFYYIDYTLAQVCAYQFYVKSLENREDTWKDYVRLCSVGGKKPFVGLCEYANLKSPFEKGSLEKVVKVIDEQLEAIDDSVF